MLPIRDIANLTSRSVIPPAFISSPANRKNGNAIITSESAPTVNLCAAIITDMSPSNMTKSKTLIINE